MKDATVRSEFDSGFGVLKQSASRCVSDIAEVFDNFGSLAWLVGLSEK